METTTPRQSTSIKVIAILEAVLIVGLLGVIYQQSRDSKSVTTELVPEQPGGEETAGTEYAGLQKTDLTAPLEDMAKEQEAQSGVSPEVLKARLKVLSEGQQ